MIYRLILFLCFILLSIDRIDLQKKTDLFFLRKRMWTVLYFLVLIFVKIYALPRTDVTVSGLSSGGAMTAQLHLVYSSTISGSGVLAGPPYYCAEDDTVKAARCLFGPAGSIPIEKLLDYLKKCVSAGTADPISNLVNDPVYIYSGLNDPIVSHEVAKLNGKIFESLNTSIKTNYEMRATHGFATNDFGASCDILDVEYYINNWYVQNENVLNIVNLFGVVRLIWLMIC